MAVSRGKHDIALILRFVSYLVPQRNSNATKIWELNSSHEKMRIDVYCSRIDPISGSHDQEC